MTESWPREPGDWTYEQAHIMDISTVQWPVNVDPGRVRMELLMWRTQANS